MNFAALEYLPFLFAVVAAFPFLPARARVPFLLAVSYAFYAWAVPWHALLLAGSTLSGWGAGLWIASEERPARRRAVLVGSAVLQLGLLAWFKYSGFLAATVRDVAALLGLAGPTWTGVLLPLGISFYTFQILSSTIDVYRRRIEPCRDLALYALYVAFFPQLVAGPIERAGHLLPQLAATRPAGLVALSEGGRLVLWGLVKKSLADRLAPSMRALVEAPELHSPAELLLGTFLMMAVLYLDFSAYTDIARGSARLFGVELVENFRRTFLVTENRQFWNRWHMSLGRWLGDYVHAPLSKGIPTYASIWRNTLIVMGLFGLWHGAGWNFVALGLTVGSLIAFEHSLQLRRYRRGLRAKPPRGPLGAARGFAWTMVLNSAILVLFFAPDLRGALHYYRCMLPLDPAGALRLGGDAPWIALVVAGLFAAHAGLARLDDARAWQRSPRAARAAALAALLVAFLLLRVAQAQPFVYFRF